MFFAAVGKPIQEGRRHQGRHGRAGVARAKDPQGKPLPLRREPDRRTRDTDGKAGADETEAYARQHEAPVPVAATKQEHGERRERQQRAHHEAAAPFISGNSQRQPEEGTGQYRRAKQPANL